MIAATKYGYQPGQRLGWAALAYHKQEGANPDPGPRKHCLQNDGKPDEWLGVRVGTWNIRWRGQGARFLGVKGRRYKWWCGNSDGTGGVAVLVKEELCEKVVEVRRRSQRVMTVVMVLEEEVLRIMCVWSTDWQNGCRERAFL